jgi:hypothetical protein
MIPLIGAAAFVVAAAANPVEGPAPMSEPAVRQRLVKLGYPNPDSLKRNGDFWEATVTKNGVQKVIRFGLSSGVQYNQPLPEKPLPKPSA